tara:strand:- start:351 stop:635 length:285 start_codon:yes stop_codon:yes gene_type:complete
MKIYTKIILDNKNNIIEERYYDYSGDIANAMGIHYTYGANKSAKLMEKKAKKAKRQQEKKEKKLAKQTPKKEEDKDILDESKPIDLNFLTNPDK